MLPTFGAFCGAALVLAMIPGPSTAVILRQAVRSGRRSALAAIAANEVGVFLWALAATFGFSGLVAASEAAYDVVRLVGAGVLVVMGLQSILGTRRPALPSSGSTDRDRGWQGFRAGLLTILANPKAAVFAASFLPQFVPPGAPVLSTMLLLSLTWVVVDTVWYLALCAAVDRMQAVLMGDRVQRRLERVSGAILVGLGVRLALDRT